MRKFLIEPPFTAESWREAQGHQGPQSQRWTRTINTLMRWLKKYETLLSQGKPKDMSGLDFALLRCLPVFRPGMGPRSLNSKAVGLRDLCFQLSHESRANIDLLEKMLIVDAAMRDVRRNLFMSGRKVDNLNNVISDFGWSLTACAIRSKI